MNNCGPPRKFYKELKNKEKESEESGRKDNRVKKNKKIQMKNVRNEI